MNFDLDQRTVEMGVGEFADFSLGPRDAGAGGAGGLWRAQLGSHWHRELRTRATAEYEAAEFEVPIRGRLAHRGWTLVLTGRLDQLVRRDGAALLREIKSVTCALPADPSALRMAFPTYFLQLAAYVSLARLGLAASGAGESRVASEPLAGPTSAELVFVEAGSGLVQTVPLTPADETFFQTQLEGIVEFLGLRLRARERLRHLRFRPAFAQPRPGQATTRADLTALFHRQPLVFFEAPTGFGKTGVLLEFALDQLRTGHFDRVLYLTSKSTGQLQVVRTLGAMTSAAAPSGFTHSFGDTAAGLERSGSPSTEGTALLSAGAEASATPVASDRPIAGTPVAAWHVRNKGEHCINHTFHCVREVCPCLEGAARRWAQSGLAQFYLDELHTRDLDALRAAGRAAQICPYEITRAALPFNDVWIGDYNYVFAPRNRALFTEQPGYVAARTLLLIDEAHNLPGRVADAYSHAFTAPQACAVRDALYHIRPPATLLTAWEHWCHFLRQLRPNNGLSAAEEDDARHLLGEISRHLTIASLDYAALGPEAADTLWQVPALLDELAGGQTGRPNSTAALPRLWWSPREGELVLTCLDAAAAIGEALREFGGVVLASATLTPIDGFAAACGLDAPPPTAPATPVPAPERLGALTKRDTKKLYRHLTSAAELLRVEEAQAAASPTLLRAAAPWRDHTYDLALDARVDTTFQHRSHHFLTTAATIAALQGRAQSAVAAFFPSYAYAEAILAEIARFAPTLRSVLQPKLRDLAAQSAWVEESLARADALFLVLGSSFAESIDSLGGRVSHAIVVGPALPEVNAVQRARLAEAGRSGLGRDAAFRKVYQIPGMTKVNQALGRLVRAPGQSARVVLHCRRFLDPGYASLLAPEYQSGVPVPDDAAFARWLSQPAFR